MFGKPPIVALHEFCAKKHFATPVYEYQDPSEGRTTFICEVKALETMAEGSGRSRKEAKHDAAANLIKLVKSTQPDILNIPQAPYSNIPTWDAVNNLRDICIQKNHPLPYFELVQQAGPPESPEFTYLCKVATIQRFATATTKKAARQKAAQLITNIIECSQMKESDKEIATLDDVMESKSEPIRKKFRNYREYNNSGMKGSDPAVSLNDRHNYFTHIHLHIKSKAKRVLADSLKFFTKEEQAIELLKQLKLKCKKEQVPGKCSEELWFMELECDYDVAFVGTKEELYSDILEYFSDMLQ